jgi:pimeloyl-ACP methyl ester carboxylesterase
LKTFDRHPSAGRWAREFQLTLGGVTMSGLLAQPADGAEPRALIVALHGLSMHAGYFDARAAAGLSLLELGSKLGFTVWAPDRPGVGASGDMPDEGVACVPQAGLLLDAIDAYAAMHPVGAGVFLVAHSYGAKVACTMAAEPRGAHLLGLDAHSCGLRYAFEWAQRTQQRSVRIQNDDRGPAWGPSAMYPPGTVTREFLPLHPVPASQLDDGETWPAEFEALAPRLKVPLRFTFGDHERYWRSDPADLDELRALLAGAPSGTTRIEPNAGHNLSLGWAATSYHLGAIAFAEQCMLRRRLGG